MINLPFVTWDGEAHTRDAEAFIDKMLGAYIECALCCSMDDNGEPLDRLDGYRVSEESDENAKFDCIAFLKLARWHIRDWTPEQLGYDFWLTRNHHGAGFWDRDFGTEESRKALTKLSHAFGEIGAVVGDDGQVWIQ